MSTSTFLKRERDPDIIGSIEGIEGDATDEGSKR